jgi:hypothetical protein
VERGCQLKIKFASSETLDVLLSKPYRFNKQQATLRKSMKEHGNNEMRG